ncbi:uncharacterized protein LOC141680559 [Apium graveolens]|uniref:uncharacterized protein LOC141680559 n=1 Tax=Apium graveolens TaxID=4045 RepID=UPI003D79612B
MKIPPDSSWIWKKVLKLHNIALQFITYDIGNGCNTSLWFDPWWEGVCLVSTLTSPIIRQCGLSSTATVGVLLQTGHWALPTPNSRHHHVDPLLTQWLEYFSFPVVRVHGEDRILWAGIHAVKIKTWNIWDSIRNRGTEISWAPAVWHKLTIYRYAHHQWVACHGRLPTLACLARFGIAFSQICYLCIGGLEADNHLLKHCPTVLSYFGKFVLSCMCTFWVTLGFTVWS